MTALPLSKPLGDKLNAVHDPALLGIVAAYRAEIRRLLHLTPSLRRTLKGECWLNLPRGDAVLVVSGPGASSARTAASGLVNRHKLSALISVGFAGGLSEHATAGTVVIANKVVESATGVTYSCAADLLSDLNAERGGIITIPAVATTRVEKSHWVARWNAIAVDMEAAAVAEVAAASGLRFTALKAITDGLDDELAIDFQRCLTENGRLSSVKIVVEGLRGIAQFRSLLLLARNSRAAAKSLAKALAAPQSQL